MMKIKVRIQPQTPILVASGKSFDPTRPDIQFISINTQHGDTVYIPGSSIKGVLRGGAEALLGENQKSNRKICITSGTMCHEDKNKAKETETKKLTYAGHCPICRLFGSGDLASRLVITDIFPFDLEDAGELKVKKIKEIKRYLSSRPGIQIDRKTGKTRGGALFEYEVLAGGELFGEITLTNYELYQPGLLFTLIALSNEGFLRYGHSKSRGLGVLKFDLVSVKTLQFGSLKGKQLKGIGLLNGKGGAHGDSGFYLKNQDIIEQEYDTVTNPLFSTFEFSTPATTKEIMKAMTAKFHTFLEEG